MAGTETTTYTFTAQDLETCRGMLARLHAIDAQLGGHEIGGINGNPASATATVRFERRAGALATGEAMDIMLQASTRLAAVCDKLIGHFDTHPEHLA